MATTKKNIYYPDDYTKVADVPADVKEMAESIDKAIDDAIENNQYDDSEIKEDITKIKKEQETQNKSIEKNAENIENNATDITALQVENANLKAQIPTGQASGEEISLSDSAKMEFVDFGLQGNSYQEVEEGKNLVILEDKEISLNGLTISIVDGVIKISGVTNVIYDFYFNVGKIKLEAGKTYYIKKIGSDNFGVKLFHEDNTSYKWFNTTESSFVADKTETCYAQLTFAGSSNITAETKLLVSLTSGADWVEGKEPKPTLENQSEVQAVGDNINIFDDTVEKVTSIINDSGNEVADTGTNDFYKQIIIPTNKNYIMHFDKINGGSTASYVRFAYYNNDTFLSREVSNTNNYIFTVPENCNKIDCRTNAGTNNGINFENLKIEKGAVTTTYSPCLQGSTQIIKSNKNLLSFEYKTGNGITFDKNRITIIDPTGYLYAGKTLVGGNSFLSGKKVIFTTISNGTISGTLDFTVHTNKVQYRFQKKHTTGTYNNDIKSEGFMFANDEYITSIFVYTTGATSNLTIDVQVEISDEATDLVEHKGNTYQIPIQKPFYKIGDVADSFIKQNNKWYEQHFIKELIFTGNENWNKSTAINTINRFTLIITDLLNGMPETADTFSNSFKAIKYSDAQSQLGITHNSQLLIVNHSFSENETITLEQFKAKLQELYNAETPVKVYYVLATPELIECTSEQTQILEQIIKDGTYKEVTHFYTTEDLKPTIEVKYYKDLETLFNKQVELESTLNNVQAQILELGGN